MREDPQLPSREPAERELCQLVTGFHQRGWCLGTSGNFSAVLQHDPLEILITRADSDKGRLQPGDLLCIGQDGGPLEPTDAQPSAEAMLHTTLATLTRAGAVMHTHSVWNTLLGLRCAAAGGLTISGFEMMKRLAGVEAHTAEVFVPVMHNSPDPRALATQLNELLAEWPSAHGFLIAGHGLYTWGQDLAEAARHVEVLEFLFECVGRRTQMPEDQPR